MTLFCIVVIGVGCFFLGAIGVLIVGLMKAPPETTLKDAETIRRIINAGHN